LGVACSRKGIAEYAYKIVIGKTERLRLLETPKSRFEDNTRMDFK
jgi:hypothetical protein